MLRRLKNLNISISYEELMNMEDDSCVKVSRTLFYSLMARAGLLKIKDQEFWRTFRKYIEIDNMESYTHNYPGVLAYYLMSVKEIKIILKQFKRSSAYIHRTSLLKSDIKASELEKMNEQLKEEYTKKKNIANHNYDKVNAKPKSRTRKK